MVGVSRDVRGVSTVELLRARNQPFTTVESLTINGREAAKLVCQPTADADVYLIRANGRIYEITPVLAMQPSQLGKGWLDLVASTFVAVPPQEATSASRIGGCS